jgi:hypothetical protein
MMTKSDINIFGHESIAHVEDYGETYIVVRNNDKQPLAMSKRFGDYKNDPIYTMYTGDEHGTGEVILQADTAKGLERIYTFHD